MNINFYLLMEDKCNKKNIKISSAENNINIINSSNNIISYHFNSNIINENSEIKIIEKISNLFSDICDDNEKEYKNDNNKLIRPFLSRNPSISIKDYLERLYKYSRISASTIILILIYIDRICNINKFKITYYNIHKLIISSMIIAVKYNEDEYYPLKFYAKLGGISKAEMAFLEYYFVSLINFNLFVKKELFDKYNDYISSADEEEEENEDENFDEDSNNDINSNNENNDDVNNYNENSNINSNNGINMNKNSNANN